MPVNYFFQQLDEIALLPDRQMPEEFPVVFIGELGQSGHQLFSGCRQSHALIAAISVGSACPRNELLVAQPIDEFGYCATRHAQALSCLTRMNRAGSQHFPHNGPFCDGDAFGFHLLHKSVGNMILNESQPIPGVRFEFTGFACFCHPFSSQQLCQSGQFIIQIRQAAPKKLVWHTGWPLQRHEE